MIRRCIDCDINTTCEDEIELCDRCKHLKANMKEEPCMKCLTSFTGCNFEPIEEEKC